MAATIKALRSWYGAEGMVHTGDVVETTERLAQIHVEEGRAKRVEGDYTTTEQAPDYDTTEQKPDREWTASGSWKTLYEGGEEVGKAQASAEEANAWTRGDKTLDEIS